MALYEWEVVAASPSMSSIAYLLFRLECLCVCRGLLLSLFFDGRRTMLDAHKANVAPGKFVGCILLCLLESCLF